MGVGETLEARPGGFGGNAAKFEDLKPSDQYSKFRKQDVEGYLCQLVNFILSL